MMGSEVTLLLLALEAAALEVVIVSVGGIAAVGGGVGTCPLPLEEGFVCGSSMAMRPW